MSGRPSLLRGWLRAALLWVAVTAILAGLPYVVNEFALHVLAIAAYYAILATSWNLLAGYMGRFSLAQQSFAAIGGYGSGLLVYHANAPVWVGIAVGTLVATAVGLGVGVLVLRMQAGYLALATWSLAATFQIMLTASYEITRGQLGLPVPSLLGHLDTVAYFWVFLGLASVCTLLMYFVVHSPVGHLMRAIKDDELRAATLGVNTTRVKIGCFAITSMFSGLAGAFYAHYVLVISPSIADFSEMGKIIAMVIVGGLGQFAGPIIGAAVVQVVFTFFQQYGAWSVVGYAAVVIVVMRLYRRGLAGLITEAVTRRPRWERALQR